MKSPAYGSNIDLIFEKILKKTVLLEQVLLSLEINELSKVTIPWK